MNETVARPMPSLVPPAAWLGTPEDWRDAVHERGRYAKSYAKVPPIIKAPKPTQLSLFGGAS